MDPHQKIQRKVFISGKVQGVGFRSATLRKAQQHRSVNGYVKNLTDGRVEAVFAGDEFEVNALIDWCHAGPSRAQVERVEVIAEPYSNQFNGFLVKKES